MPIGYCGPSPQIPVSLVPSSSASPGIHLDPTFVAVGPHFTNSGPFEGGGSRASRPNTVLPSERAGDAVRSFLGSCSAADLHVWPVWDQNVLMGSLTSIPIAHRLPGDIMLPVGNQQLPFRGHAKASGGHLPRRQQYRPGCIVLEHQAESGVAERHYPHGPQTRGLQRDGCDLRGPEGLPFRLLPLPGGLRPPLLEDGSCMFLLRHHWPRGHGLPQPPNQASAPAAAPRLRALLNMTANPTASCAPGRTKPGLGAAPASTAPLDDLPPIGTALLIQDRLTGLEQRSLTIERALRALPDLLIQRIGETIVPKITAEVLKAVQIWACSQSRFKKSRSRSASPNATPRRRKLTGTANPLPPPFNPVLVPPSPAPPVPDPVLVPAQAMEDDP
ncbi:hypothetical protein HPB49_014979 [Dermacentor silvarum]|uniref:Uncharacterized protein n=1 Tax=Dermacentor silvarum TaxID=543639 RepID=A0ACB8DDT8_DERSI|nr:hypothetical protein HPB49_014979 [Dermacentor silvarum]